MGDAKLRIMERWKMLKQAWTKMECLVLLSHMLHNVFRHLALRKFDPFLSQWRFMLLLKIEGGPKGALPEKELFLPDNTCRTNLYSYRSCTYECIAVEKESDTCSGAPTNAVCGGGVRRKKLAYVSLFFSDQNFTPPGCVTEFFLGK